MENSQEVVVGRRDLMKRNEMRRVMTQCLYFLEFGTSAPSSPENDQSQIYKFRCPQFSTLESQILEGNWEESINVLLDVNDLKDYKTRARALYCILRSSIREYVSLDLNDSANKIIQRDYSEHGLRTAKIRRRLEPLLHISTPMGEEERMEHRKALVNRLENVIFPITLLDRRLEGLVHMARDSQCMLCPEHKMRVSISQDNHYHYNDDDLPTKTLQVLREHTHRVLCVQFSNGGKHLATSSGDRKVIIWKVPERGKLTCELILRGFEKPVSLLSWSPSDKQLLTCEKKGSLSLWHVPNRTCIIKIDKQYGAICSCAWLPESQGFFFGSSEPNWCIYVFRLNENQIEKLRNIPGRIIDLATTPNAEFLICVLERKEILVYNLLTGSQHIITEESRINSVSVSRSGHYLLVNLKDFSINAWDIARQSDRHTFAGPKQGKSGVRSCFGGQNSHFIASGSENAEVCIWHWVCLKPIKTLSGHSNSVKCVSWNPTRPKMLASGSKDRTVRIWGPGSKPRGTYFPNLNI